MRQKQRRGKESAGSKEFGCGGLAFRWPREIEGLSIGLQGSVGDDIVSRRVRGRSGFLKTSPVGLDT